MKLNKKRRYNGKTKTIIHRNKGIMRTTKIVSRIMISMIEVTEVVEEALEGVIEEVKEGNLEEIQEVDLEEALEVALEVDSEVFLVTEEVLIEEEIVADSIEREILNMEKNHIHNGIKIIKIDYFIC